MPPAEPDVAAIVRERLSAYLPVLLAVSGGPDSTALLVAAAETLPRERLSVVTIDHDLRSGSADEAAAVAALCAARGLSHVVRRWTGPKPATGLQDAARDFRLAVFEAEAAACGAHAVALAHTLDDQAETVLMRLGGGSGIAGLAGMAPVTAFGPRVHVRPFLDVPKAALLRFLADRGIEAASDPSNADPRFKRPRLRRLMPLLAQEGIDARALARFADRARRADEALEACARLLTGEATEPGVVAFARWSAAPLEVRLRVLARQVAALGAAARAPSEAELLRLDHTLREGGTATLGGLVFRVRAGAISAVREGPRRAARGAGDRLRG